MDGSAKGTELPGYKKKSFAMFFGGGEIWFEHLDGIYNHTNLAIEKLERDYLCFKAPSKPSLIAVNVDETVVTDELIAALKSKLAGDKYFTKVVIVGATAASKRKLQKALSGNGFALAFMSDFEKAKEWLVEGDR